MEHQIISKVPNDMPWGDTRWANQSGLALSHYDNRLGPNAVLELPNKKKSRKTANQTDNFMNIGGDIDIAGCSLWMCDYGI